MRGRDGYTFDGYKIRVEFPRASSRGGSYRRQSSGYGRPSNKAKGYQLLVSGLPPTGSWQVGKEKYILFMRAHDVAYRT